MFNTSIYVGGELPSLPKEERTSELPALFKKIEKIKNLAIVLGCVGVAVVVLAITGVISPTLYPLGIVICSVAFLIFVSVGFLLGKKNIEMMFKKTQGLVQATPNSEIQKKSIVENKRFSSEEADEIEGKGFRLEVPSFLKAYSN